MGKHIPINKREMKGNNYILQKWRAIESYRAKNCTKLYVK